MFRLSQHNLNRMTSNCITLMTIELPISNWFNIAFCGRFIWIIDRKQWNWNCMCVCVCVVRTIDNRCMSIYVDSLKCEKWCTIRAAYNESYRPSTIHRTEIMLSSNRRREKEKWNWNKPSPLELSSFDVSRVRNRQLPIYTLISQFYMANINCFNKFANIRRIHTQIRQAKKINKKM